MRMHVVVRGRVQGVGFRWFVREEARKLGLAGWVKNRTDGYVETMAEGDAAALDRLRKHLRTGPHGAVVDDLQELPEGNDALPNPFTILR